MVLYVGLFAVIGVLALKILNKDIYRLLPPLILPNTGNMGLPICLFAYGKLGLAIAAAVTSVIVVFHFSLNILLASRKFSFKPLINCVSIYALIISLFFVYFKIPSPKFLENATFLIAYSTIFLVLMSLGVALSKLKIFSFNEKFFKQWPFITNKPTPSSNIFFLKPSTAFFKSGKSSWVSLSNSFLRLINSVIIWGLNEFSKS